MFTLKLFGQNWKEKTTNRKPKFYLEEFNHFIQEKNKKSINWWKQYKWTANIGNNAIEVLITITNKNKIYDLTHEYHLITVVSMYQHKLSFRLMCYCYNLCKIASNKISLAMIPVPHWFSFSRYTMEKWRNKKNSNTKWILIWFMCVWYCSLTLNIKFKEYFAFSEL